MGMEQLDLLEAGGMNLAHVCLSHTDLTLDPAYMKSLMKRGERSFPSIMLVGILWDMTPFECRY